jgi:hypothetical protein
VRHDRAAVLAGRVDQVPHDQRPAQRRHQRVAVHVEGVGAQGRQAEVGGELLAGVHHDALGSATVQGALPDDLHVLAALADVERDGDDLTTELVGEVRNGHGGVETSGEGKNDPLGHGVLLSRFSD